MRAPSSKQRLKAAEYLWQGRVTIHDASPHGCRATVRGTATYTVEARGGRWACTCPLQQHRPSWACTHIAAVWVWWHARYGEREDGHEQQREEAASVRTDRRAG